jgi:hypothetical protein
MVIEDTLAIVDTEDRPGTVESLETRVRKLEKHQRDDAALKEFILNTISEGLKTKGSASLPTQIRNTMELTSDA